MPMCYLLLYLMPEILRNTNSDCCILPVINSAIIFPNGNVNPYLVTLYIQKTTDIIINKAIMYGVELVFIKLLILMNLHARLTKTQYMLRDLCREREGGETEKK